MKYFHIRGGAWNFPYTPCNFQVTNFSHRYSLKLSFRLIKLNNRI